MPPQQSAAAPFDVTRSRPRRSLETINIWALFITLIAAVFVYTPPALLSFTTSKTFLLAAGALVTLALYILARLSRGNVIFPPLLLVGALWLPVVAYALSTAFSGVPFGSALWGTALEPDTLGFMLIAAVLGTLAALSLRRPDHYRSFLTVGAWVFCAVAFFEAFAVIVGRFAPDILSPAFSIVGSFGDLAFLMGLGLIGVLITLRSFDASARARRVLLAAGVAALFLLAIANAALVWMLLALVSLGLFVEAVMQRSPGAPDADLDEGSFMDGAPYETEEGTRSLVLPLAVLAVSLFFLIGGALGGVLANALQVNILDVRPSWQSTFAVANKTYATAPLFGTGPGTFGAEWLTNRDASLNSTVFWNIDFTAGIGFIPTSFITTGLLGALAWVAFLGLFLILGLRMLILRAPEDPFVRHVSLLSFVASLYLFVIAVFGLPNTLILALAFVFAGLFISTTRFAARGGQRGVLFSKSPRLGFVIVFVLTVLLLSSVVAAYTLVGRSIAAAELTRAGTTFGNNDLDTADAAAQNSLSFAPSASAYQLQAGIAAARLNQIVSSSTMPRAAAQAAFQTALSAGINAALTATNLAPTDYQNWLALGNLYAQAVPLGVTGAYDSAKTSYEKARALNPTNPQIPYILAQLNIANKNTKAAEDDLKAAITLKQDYTPAIFLLSQLQVQDGNVKDALASALAAAYFTPNDPNILFQIGILYAAQNDLANAAAALAAAVTANPQFANARYFLSAVYAKQGDFENALKEMRAIANMSSDNATAVAVQIASLASGKNPFPANLLTLSPAPVSQ